MGTRLQHGATPPIAGHGHPSKPVPQQATQPDPSSAAASAGPGENICSPTPPAVNTAPLPIEMDARVPPSGVVVIAGLQKIWVGKNYAGLTVTLWIYLTCIHIDRSLLSAVGDGQFTPTGRRSLSRHRCTIRLPPCTR